MNKVELRKNLIGVVSVGLSFALGMALYNAFLIADLQDVEKEDLSVAPKKAVNPAPRPAAPPKQKMKAVSGHGQAVDDNKNDNQRAQTTKKMIANAPSSEMLG